MAMTICLRAVAAYVQVCQARQADFALTTLCLTLCDQVREIVYSRCTQLQLVQRIENTSDYPLCWACLTHLGLTIT